MNDERGNTLILVLITILLLLVVVFGFFAGINAFKFDFFTTKQDSQTQIKTENKMSQRTEAQPTPVDLAESVQSLTAYLIKIFKGDIEFSDPFKSEVPTYSPQSIRFPHGNVRMVVYKYIPGQVMNAGYEGGKWTIDMNAWVNYLSSLKIGQTTAKRVGFWGEDKAESPILVKQMGGKIYGVYDTSFKPAATCSRNYDTYDKVNKQIIIIHADTDCKGIVYLKNSATFEFSQGRLDYFTEVEKVLDSIK